MSNIKENLLKYKSILALAILCIIVSIISPTFLQVSNLRNLFTQISVNAVISLGMTFVILTGGIDLSVGSIVAIAGAVAAATIKNTGSIPLAILAALFTGVLVGFINGIIVAKGKVQAFVATLATQTVFRGVTYVFTGGNPISGLGNDFIRLTNSRILGIPVPVVITIIVFAICVYLLTQTRYGRYIYAVGGNEDSSRLSGISVNNVKNWAYIISGATAAIAGIIVTSRIGSAAPTAGNGYELDAIAAIVIGGANLVGGEGTIFGTIIGVLIIGVLSNGLNLMDVSAFYQTIVKGLVILLAVLIEKKKATN
ncbi:ABC transporter permease subunit [Clostridium estertheticum]|uniref:ABC transporter permease subunit n=1 Tax=Clostridium estertheticum TaxID=238834 RepID=UPI001C7DE639|nr:ribose ABC transporter permease [Clostridium estertheticum]MBX4264062.1 ribose ABC transporter permease [Clostridium estertheticum]WLC87167.1 ribose ABC transporter permease [Clostridium estertheticum]